MSNCILDVKYPSHQSNVCFLRLRISPCPPSKRDASPETSWEALEDKWWTPGAASHCQTSIMVSTHLQITADFFIFFLVSPGILYKGSGENQFISLQPPVIDQSWETFKCYCVIVNMTISPTSLFLSSYSVIPYLRDSSLLRSCGRTSMNVSTD